MFGFQVDIPDLWAPDITHAIQLEGTQNGWGPEVSRSLFVA